jgi:signal transduction histidine kinase
MQEWLARLYKRHGTRYVWLGAIGAPAGYVLGVTLPLSAFALSRYEGLSVAQFGVMLAVLECAGLTIIVGAFYFARADLRGLLAWAAGADDPLAAERAMLAAHRLPRRLAVGGLLVGLVLAGPAAVLSLPAAAGRLALADAVFLALACVPVVLYAAMICWSIIEATARPVIAEIATRVPSVNRIHGRPTPLFFRMVASVALVAVVGGILLGALVLKFGAGPSEGLRALGFSWLVALTLVLARIVMLALSVLEPTRELMHAARSVGAGDFKVQVPVTGTDDLGELSQGFNEMVAGLRERAALRDQNAVLVDELRASRARIVASADAGRRRVERDLHDGAQQRLVLLGLKLGIAHRLIRSDPAAAEAAHEELRAELDAALAELRDLAHGIYPTLLESEGLPGALREAAGRAAIPVELHCDGARRYPPELEAAVYFCCLEALQNTAKHAGPHATATVTLAERDHTMTFEVADHGDGFESSKIPVSTGLQNMTDRIGALGGTLEVRSTPGSGTTISGTIPLEPS